MSDTNATNSSDLPGLIADLCEFCEEKRQAHRIEMLKMTRAGRKLARVRNPTALDYEIILTSLWKDHGEKDVHLCGKGPLSDLILQFPEALPRGFLVGKSENPRFSGKLDAWDSSHHT